MRRLTIELPPGAVRLESIRVLVDEPQDGVRNMAVDEALMRDVPSRGGPTIRFYRWTPGCLSFGRNQAARGRYDEQAAAERGIDVVRRPTGGRAVYHDRELTYAVVASADAWGSLRNAYLRINRALARGLRELGIPAECAGADVRPGRAPGPTARACFADPLPGEVTAGGRKLIGSAQWRDGETLLQHGSILLADDQEVLDLLRTHQSDDRAEGKSRSGATSLTAFLGRPPALTDLVQALVRGFEREFSTTALRGAMSPGESRDAGMLAAKYADSGWTWRR